MLLLTSRLPFVNEAAPLHAKLQLLLMTLCRYIGNAQADNRQSSDTQSTADTQWHIGTRLQLDHHHFANTGSSKFSDRSAVM